jgi:hypothetical protein
VFGRCPRVKRFTLLVITSFLLFACFTENVRAEDSSKGLLHDLVLLEQLESPELFEYIKEYSVELRKYYDGASGTIRSIKSGSKPTVAHEALFVLGSYARPVNDRSMLFRDELFMDYYRLRTVGVLEEYKESGIFVFDSFIGKGRNDFDRFMAQGMTDAGKRDRAVLLLQDKLVDRLFSDAVKDKEAYFDQVLALRKASEWNNVRQRIYELMESRVRLRLLEELLQINKDTVSNYLNGERVLIKSSASGILSFKYISDVENRTLMDYSLYLAADNPYYKLRLPLGRLVSIYSQAAFTGRDGSVKLMSRDSVWNSIAMGAEGLELKLEDAYISEGELPAYDVFSKMPESKADAHGTSPVKGEESGKELPEAENTAAYITAGLSALDSYTALKARGISNAYTGKFEAGKGAWLSELNARLSQMNGTDTGYVGLLRYIRRYVDYSRESTAAGLPESVKVLRFRDKVLQFRSADEGMLWILDMLYKLKYLDI